MCVAHISWLTSLIFASFNFLNYLVSYVFRLFTHSHWWLIIVACGEHTNLCTLEGASRESHLSHINSILETRKATLQRCTRWLRNLHVFCRKLIRGRGWRLGGSSVGSWHAPDHNLNGRAQIPRGSLSAWRIGKFVWGVHGYNATWFGELLKRGHVNHHICWSVTALGEAEDFRVKQSCVCKRDRG